MQFVIYDHDNLLINHPQSIELSTPVVSSKLFPRMTVMSHGYMPLNAFFKSPDLPAWFFDSYMTYLKVELLALKDMESFRDQWSVSFMDRIPECWFDALMPYCNAIWEPHKKQQSYALIREMVLLTKLLYPLHACLATLAYARVQSNPKSAFIQWWQCPIRALYARYGRALAAYGIISPYIKKIDRLDSDAIFKSMVIQSITARALTPEYLNNHLKLKKEKVSA